MTQAHPTLSLSISQALQILCGEAYGKELEGKGWLLNTMLLASFFKLTPNSSGSLLRVLGNFPRRRYLEQELLGKVFRWEVLSLLVHWGGRWVVGQYQQGLILIILCDFEHEA